MRRWEYRRETARGILSSSDLDDAGDCGWELIVIIPDSTTSDYVHVFKRPAATQVYADLGQVFPLQPLAAAANAEDDDYYVHDPIPYHCHHRG